jgi:hypothetical protein
VIKQAADISRRASSDDLGRWNALREVPAWALSLAVHLLVLFLLGSMTYLRVDTNRDTLITSEVVDPDADLYQFDAVVADMVGNDSDMNTLSPSQKVAEQLNKDPQKETEQKLEDEILQVNDPKFAEFTQPSEDILAETIPTEGQIASENTGGVQGAIDRLTFEIAGSLKENKTLVVWLFDVSPSMHVRREEIADRIENVYRQLGLLEVRPERALKSAVAAFGEKIKFITDEPVDEARQVVAAIRNVEGVDDGKYENVFSSVVAVANKFKPYRVGRLKRNVMIIIVTDEAGTDMKTHLEEAISITKRYGMKCYVVGNASPFGREEVIIDWEGGLARMTPGPETIYPERLWLPFWGINSSDLGEMSSGFGPYGLTRLCAESGGIFLISEDTRGLKFDPSSLRAYYPDYRPVREYEDGLRKNLAKAMLVKAAMHSKVENIPSPTLTFRHDNDNVLRVQITDAQKPLAVLDYRLGELAEMLGRGEEDRKKVVEPRWRAGYDLAMGRVLSMRVRAYGYNAMLADMKANPKAFEGQDNNTWRLRQSREISSGPSVRKLAEKATGYLTRVIDEHPGTPWAILAERELSQPMGWDWQEAKRNYPKLDRQPATEEEARLLLAEEERQRNMNRPPNANKPKPIIDI